MSGCDLTQKLQQRKFDLNVLLIDLLSNNLIYLAQVEIQQD